MRCCPDYFVISAAKHFLTTKLKNNIEKLELREKQLLHEYKNKLDKVRREYDEEMHRREAEFQVSVFRLKSKVSVLSKDLSYAKQQQESAVNQLNNAKHQAESLIKQLENAKLKEKNLIEELEYAKFQKKNVIEQLTDATDQCSSLTEQVEQYKDDLHLERDNVKQLKTQLHLMQAASKEETDPIKREVSDRCLRITILNNCTLFYQIQK